MLSVRAKICGLVTAASLATALDGGAAFVGFVTYPNSPRYISPKDARTLAQLALGIADTVSVLVDPDDALLDAVIGDLAPDLIQLQGCESPQRCAQIRARGVKIIRAFSVEARSDLDPILPFLEYVDYVLLDAKPPVGSSRPGGLGHTFDWTILSDFTCERPWFLSGGLTPENVASGISQTGAALVDVSSGVESAPGLKDSARIAAFLAAVNETDWTNSQNGRT
ncbi:phosphoribosylanthranilate isomerase [Candidatus Phycosocius spiralis]|uniref:N-(5'-phosphoribosyl)anthranilate isomerase n=1 Tax=Candidatus Phycosocius spiralis TaxID=2815099 RepID=A0ABQ4PUD1_9PROT|nr:phosphoribosylanthranilate isomerase [Candidatus Phycosocius spiralis]GIU66622.1 N-(5'-phosphoribosyl)anthranilate isomerase [Candidatus Phycosocius spiralis]